jgi:hypothetical protein
MTRNGHYYQLANIVGVEKYMYGFKMCIYFSKIFHFNETWSKTNNVLTYIPTDFVTGKKMEGFNQYKNYTMLKRGKMRNYIIIVKMYLPKKFENRRGINQWLWKHDAQNKNFKNWLSWLFIYLMWNEFTSHTRLVTGFYSLMKHTFDSQTSENGAEMRRTIVVM